MDLLLLPGNSKRSKDWLEQADRYLAPQFDKTYRHDYAHWEKDEPEIDLNLELKKLTELVKTIPQYMIFAKSAGTILTSKGTAMSVLRPRACLFVGFPLAMVNNQNLPARDWLETANFPISILQHTSDPLGSFRDVEQYIKAINHDNISVHEIAGDTHDYLEFHVFSDFTQKLAR